MNARLLNTIKTLSPTQYILWSIFLLNFIYFIFINLPYKGCDFLDHGYYLYNAQMLSKGIIPISGFGALINTIFLKLGFHNYLFFERIYYPIFAIAFIIFWSSIKPISKSCLLPLALIIGFMKNPFYMMDYQTSPVIFLLLGLGLLFRAVNCKSLFTEIWFYIISAIFLSISACSSIQLFPTIFTTWFCLLFLLKSNKKTIYSFHLPYFITSFGLCITYFMSPNSVLKEEVFQPVTFMGTISKIPGISLHLSYNLMYVIIFILIAWIAFKLKELTNNKEIAFSKLYTLPIAIFLISIITLFVTSPDINYLWHVIKIIFVNRNTGISQVIKDNGWDYLTSYGMIPFYMFVIACVTLKKTGKLSKKIIIASVIAALNAALVATTAQGPIYYHIALWSPVFLAITFLLFENGIESTNNQWRKVSNTFFISLMTALAIIGIYFQAVFTYPSAYSFDNKIKITRGILRGTYVAEEKNKALATMTNQYQANNCQNKYFLAYPHLPLLYYIFSREAPYNKPWQTSHNEIRDSKTLNFLGLVAKQKHWCVIEAEGFIFIEDTQELDVTKFLKKNSTIIHAYKFSPPKNTATYPEHYRFYVK